MNRKKEKSIKYNAFMNVILTLSNIIFPMISFPYITRVLSVEGIGKYNFYTGIGNYAILFAGMGISTYGVKKCAQVKTDRQMLSKTVQELLIVKCICSVCVLLILIFMCIGIPKFRSDISLFFIQCFLVLFNILNIEWLFSGLEEYEYVTKRSILFKLLSLLLLFIFVRHENDYVVYSLIIAFSSVGGLVCNLIYSRKFVTYKKFSEYNLKVHIKPALTLFAAILAVNIYTNLDTVMLGFMCNDSSVGYYSVAVKIKTILLSLVNAISAVLLPRFTSYIAQGQIEKYNFMIKKSILYIAYIAIPLTFFFVFQAKNTILVIAGQNYAQATRTMQILMPILIISGFSNITGNQILLPNSLDRYFMQAVILGAVIDCVFNLLLIPVWEYNGAALATLFAEIGQTTIQIYYSRKYLKSNVDWKNLLKILSLTCFLTFVCCGLLGHITENAFLNIFISGVLFGFLYIVLSIAFGIIDYKGIVKCIDK